jgi:5'-nucleotidase
MKKIVYVDMDNVLVDFQSAFPKLSKKVLDQYKDDEDDIPGIFGLMEPMPDAIESFIELTKHFDTYVLSTAPWNNPSAWSDKLLWIKKNLSEHASRSLILTHHKNLNTGDYLIDDRTARGADRFSGEHIHFGTNKFPNWQSVMKYLRSKEQL